MTERRTRANGRASRAAILDAARQVFAERGLRGTSLAAIAERVGMTQPGLLHHFSSKDDLLLAVVRDREARTAGDVAAHLAAFELQRAVAELARINTAAKVEQLLLTTLSAEAVVDDHPAHEHFVERYRTLRARLAEALVQARSDGRVRADVDPVAVAREVLATLDGLHLQWLLDPGEVDLGPALEAYVHRLVEDLRPR